MQRRMAALFLLAVGLIAWQAPLTRPTEPPPSVQVTAPGEQLYPIAVPDADPIPLPARFLEALPEAARPARPAVNWAPEERPESPSGPQPGSCDLLLRVSRYHWARRSLSAGQLSALAREAGSRTGEWEGAKRTYHIAARDFADDDDGDGDPLDAGELVSGPAGAEVETECRAFSTAGGPVRP